MNSLEHTTLYISNAQQGYWQQIPNQQILNTSLNSPKQPSGWGKLWASLGLAFAVLIIQAFGMLLGMLSRSDDAMIAVGEITGGVIAILFVYLIGGKQLARPSLEGFAETWHIIRWIFIADAILAVIDAVSIVSDGSFAFAQLWGLRIILLALMCIGIGLFEEATFRGLIFNGLLARMGITHKGIVGAVVISSVVFGLMHIDPTSIDWSDSSQRLQAILKVAQTGIFGFAAAVAVLKTQRIWPIALFHGINDFMLMFVEMGLQSNPTNLSYVSEGTDGLVAIALYIVICAAYTPSLVVAWRILKEHSYPDRGQFYKTYAYQPAQPMPYLQAYAPVTPTYMPQASAYVPTPNVYTPTPSAYGFQAASYTPTTSSSAPTPNAYAPTSTGNTTDAAPAATQYTTYPPTEQPTTEL